ncbi:MAG: hypothetical protein P1P89_02215 [Desulfobacterales bacterium]|nr:hypothetical protein [Desulfobacterales bacterium]
MYSSVMKSSQFYNHESPFKRWWNSRSFIQQRLIRFCFSMLVMVVCFPLYYLGLFGGVEGPLNPARIGEQLAGMGVTRTHSMLLFLSLLIIAVSWNWIYNLVSLLIGARLTCKRSLSDDAVCGAPVKRSKIINKKTGRKVPQYICTKGHKRPDAHFHPVRKGTVSHSIWVISLAFCIIVFFMS